MRYVTLLSFSLLISLVSAPVEGQYALLELELPAMIKGKVVDLQQDQLGLLWLATDRGLYRFDGANAKAYPHVPHTREALRCDNINSLYVNHDGRLLIGTQCGLHRYVKRTDQFRFYDTMAQVSFDVMQEDVDGYLWTWTKRGLCWLYHEPGGTPEWVCPTIVGDLDLTQLEVVDLAISPDALVWLATNQGLAVVDASDRQHLVVKRWLPNQETPIGSILSVERNITGQICLGTTTGLLVVNSNLSETDSILIDHCFRSWTQSNDLFLSSTGSLFFTDGNEVRMADHKGDYKSIDLNYGFHWPEENIKRIKEDRLNRGQVYILTDQGKLHYLQRADIESYQERSPLTSEPISLIELNSGQDFTSPKKELVRQGHVFKTEPGEGVLHFRNGDSLELIDHLEYKIDQPGSLPSNTIYCWTASDTVLWIGSDQGLVHYDFISHELHTIGVAEGLPDKVIRSVRYDGSGNLWVLSENALYVRPRSKTGFSHLAYAVGNLSGAIELIPRQDGMKLLMEDQALIGLAYDHEPTGRNIVPVRVEGLSDAAGNKYNLLHRTPGTSIKVPFDDNSITIDFLTILPMQTQDFNFRFELNGADHQDGDLKDAKQFALNSLSSGQYELRIEAMDRRGQLCGQDEIRFSVLPPFWLSPEFFALMSLFALAMIFGYAWIIRSERIQREKQVKKIKERAAADFHDELGSKLAVISLYANMINENRKHEERGPVGDYLDKVLDSANELYFTMKDVIWTFKPEAENLRGLLEHLETLTIRTLTPANIDVKVVLPENELPDTILDVSVVKNLTLMSREIVNNALRHSSADRFDLLSEYSDGQLSICWRDNGIGIDPSAEKGEGLKSIRDRADQLRAKLEIKTSPSQGTEIKIDLNVS